MALYKALSEDFGILLALLFSPYLSDKPWLDFEPAKKLSLTAGKKKKKTCLAYTFQSLTTNILA